jgi:hypothetical protein
MPLVAADPRTPSPPVRLSRPRCKPGTTRWVTELRHADHFSKTRTSHGSAGNTRGRDVRGPANTVRTAGGHVLRGCARRAVSGSLLVLRPAGWRRVSGLTRSARPGPGLGLDLGQGLDRIWWPVPGGAGRASPPAPASCSSAPESSRSSITRSSRTPRALSGKEPVLRAFECDRNRNESAGLPRGS